MNVLTKLSALSLLLTTVMLSGCGNTSEISLATSPAVCAGTAQLQENHGRALLKHHENTHAEVIDTGVGLLKGLKAGCENG